MMNISRRIQEAETRTAAIETPLIEIQSVISKANVIAAEQKEEHKKLSHRKNQLAGQATALEKTQ